MFVFDSLKNNVPLSVSNYFVCSRETHEYETRNILKLYVPAFNTFTYGKFSIKYQCIANWNNSLKDIKNAFISKYSTNNEINNLLDLNRTQFYNLIT